MEDEAQNERERGVAPESRDAGARWRLRSLFAPTDTGDAVVDLIATHGRELELRSEKLLTAVHDLERREEQARELHLQVEQILREGSAELDARQDELNALASELDRRASDVAAAEELVAERSRELGAVELRRAAVERREENVRARAIELERQAAELTSLADRIGSTATEAPATVVVDEGHVLLVVAGTYRLVERDGAPPQPGDRVALDDGDYRCLRLARSPFPADRRRCAVLEPVRLGSGTAGA